MTKREELILLNEINNLILSAGPESYIADTFAGIVDLCRENIENDFGNRPVQDLADVRNLLYAEQRNHDETKKLLDEAQNMASKAIDERDALRVQIREVEEQRDALSDCVTTHNEMAEKTDTILRQSLMKAYANEVIDYGDARYGYTRAVREITKALGFTDEEIWNVEKYVRSIAETDEDLVATMSAITLSSIREERDE